MKIKEIIAEIERVAPLDTALPYDNPGLIVGNDEKECTGVLLTVDATYGALKEAENNSCNLIISHHPIIFTPRKSFLNTSSRHRGGVPGVISINISHERSGR